MPVTLVIDVILVFVLIGYLTYGFRTGLMRSIGGIVGVVGGGMAAYFAIPFIGRLVPAPEWRAFSVLLLVLVMLAIGHSVGAALGHAIRKHLRAQPLRALDRTLGAIVNVVVAALVVSVLAAGVTSLGVPMLSPAVASSGVVRAIDGTTPDPVKSFLAQARSFAIEEGLPLIADAFGPAAPPPIPDIDTSTGPLSVAAQSVVRISGTAYSCGQSQSGTGFVIAPERVVTNAHVLAGVDEPVVEAPGDGGRTGRIVYFDPVDDLAVIAVPGLPTPALAINPGLGPGARGVVDGYPFGGPFTSRPAEVVSIDQIVVPDIYGESPSARQVFVLAADVDPGNSGGPFLDQEGAVAGVIFGRGENTENVGYALTLQEVGDVLDRAPALSERVPSGECVRG
ncbi:MarP family serine protease [Lysobacter korlensis]|uniref:MarP family serine protease n=1 Tax=Lysobacter korlensis TaxID=553636 RepID=A0ABV6RYZ4_9GAMM